MLSSYFFSLRSFFHFSYDPDLVSPSSHVLSLQVTCEYDYIDGLLTPIRVHSIVVSAQHEEAMDLATMRQHLQEHVIKPVIPEEYMDENTTVYLQPSGR